MFRFSSVFFVLFKAWIIYCIILKMKFINSFQELFIYFPSRVSLLFIFLMFHSPHFALELPTLQSVCNDENQKYRFSIFSAAPSRIWTRREDGKVWNRRKTSQKIKIIFKFWKLTSFRYLVTHLVRTSFFSTWKNFRLKQGSDGEDSLCSLNNFSVFWEFLLGIFFLTFQHKIAPTLSCATD